jgi:hypothetical protein
MSHADRRRREVRLAGTLINCNVVANDVRDYRTNTIIR